MQVSAYLVSVRHLRFSPACKEAISLFWTSDIEVALE